MTSNIVEECRKAIRSQEHTKEAALERLQRAGIVTKSGKLAKAYRPVAHVAR
ncbi:MAG: hypothetical protein HUK21_11175 [Fibrobacteraceae bacterium]|nr:hypothetical protein [Fibrobacteraceae bacterium]